MTALSEDALLIPEKKPYAHYSMTLSRGKAENCMITGQFAGIVCYTDSTGHDGMDCPKGKGFHMPKFLNKCSIIRAAGNKPKIIEEYVGQVNSHTDAVSIARMKSPSGWIEPGQTPEFDEYTIVLRGMLRVETKNDVTDIRTGQAIITPKGEWVRYGTPEDDGAEYISVCVPAFSPAIVHRDE